MSACCTFTTIPRYAGLASTIVCIIRCLACSQFINRCCCFIAFAAGTTPTADAASAAADIGTAIVAFSGYRCVFNGNGTAAATFTAGTASAALSGTASTTTGIDH